MKHQESGNRQVDISRVTSLEQPDGESEGMMLPLSPLAGDYVIEILHDLSNAFASVLMNAQVLDGKMPSYSRSKRYIHEIQRSAQRGGAQLKRLLQRLPVERGGAGESELGFGQVPPVAERTEVVAGQGPSVITEDALPFAPSVATQAAPDFASRLDAHRRV